MIHNLKDLILSEKDEGPEDTSQLVFRCIDVAYPTKRGYAQKQEMRFLSRRSNVCDWGLLDELKEFGAIFPDKLENGELYYLTTTNHSYDWESGSLDSYDLIFCELVE